VDARRAARAAAILCLIALVTTAIILTVAGVDKNDQITELRSTGVPVTVTVTGCIGLLGGSGSNAAGYACRGSYRFHGQRYEESIPGNVNRAPGSALQGVIAPSDPALLSTPAQLRGERASWGVFIAPIVLGALACAAAVVVAVRRAGRRGDATATPASTDAPPADQAGGV
jgi:hypothetical protein